jgi:hypothetical protein
MKLFDTAELKKGNEPLYRLRFDIGEFHTYSTLNCIERNNKTVIRFDQDLEIDIHEHKYLKISLIGIKGRIDTNQPLLNQLATEHVLTHVTLRLSDFIGQVQAHNITFNKSTYQVKIKETKDSITEPELVNCAIEIKTVNGAYEGSAIMEGNQCLIAKYCIYQNAYVAKVLSVNRNNQAVIQILESQPRYKESGKTKPFEVNIKGGDLKLIERYGGLS